MASAGGEWIVTMDEDGQHDPADIPAMLDRAMDQQVGVVYARPVNGRQHGRLRNLASDASKRVIDLLVPEGNTGIYHSYRLMLGEVGRGVAAYAGAGVYLDVALGWVANGAATCPVTLRPEGTRPSGYRLRSLLSHFWRLVLTSGTRLLRLVAVVGAVFALLGMVFAVVLVANKLFGGEIQPGWTSVMVVTLVGMGAILLTLGIVAEYLGIAVDMAMGKPLYLVASDPLAGPLGRRPVGGAR
jgi:undecaprenyl-phosphate 4-deoxy-4-formamido-L-arabinose transferase